MDGVWGEIERIGGVNSVATQTAEELSRVARAVVALFVLAHLNASRINFILLANQGVGNYTANNKLG